MGQATIATSDPSSAIAGSVSSSTPAGSSSFASPLEPVSTDDLLAQLAGDEIDRLLADAEIERPPIDAAELPRSGRLPQDASDPRYDPPAPLTAPIPSTPSIPPAPTAAMDPPYMPSDAPTDDGPAAEIASSMPGGAPAAQDVEEVLAPALAAETAATLTGRPIADVADDSTETGDSPPRHSVPTARRDAVDSTQTASAPPPPSITDADLAELDARPMSIVEESDADTSSAPASIPLLLRPLLWLSAPCPRPLRGILGKVAILTLINSLGLLAYVWVKRH